MLCFSLLQNSISLSGYTMFVYPSGRWTLELFLVFLFFFFMNNSSVNIPIKICCVYVCFHLFQTDPKEGIAWLYSQFIYISRNCQTLFQSDCFILCSHLLCVQFPGLSCYRYTWEKPVSLPTDPVNCQTFECVTLDHVAPVSSSDYCSCKQVEQKKRKTNNKQKLPS